MEKHEILMASIIQLTQELTLEIEALKEEHENMVPKPPIEVPPVEVPEQPIDLKIIDGLDVSDLEVLNLYGVETVISLVAPIGKILMIKNQGIPANIIRSNKDYGMSLAAWLNTGDSRKIKLGADFKWDLYNEFDPVKPPIEEPVDPIPETPEDPPITEEPPDMSRCMSCM